MGNFRSNDRGGFGSRSGGNRGRDRGRGGGFGGRGGGFGGRDRERRPQRRAEMHDAICSNCFRENEGSSGTFSVQSGPSSDQFSQINKKLDKILAILASLELTEGDSDEYDEEES